MHGEARKGNRPRTYSTRVLPSQRFTTFAARYPGFNQDVAKVVAEFVAAKLDVLQAQQEFDTANAQISDLERQIRLEEEFPISRQVKYKSGENRMANIYFGLQREILQLSAGLREANVVGIRT